ncbi:MAG: hypothetical protein ACI90V_001586, partial [Bacillariaceae sp.]|jgi:hypothetical protein
VSKDLCVCVCSFLTLRGGVSNEQVSLFTVLERQIFCDIFVLISYLSYFCYCSLLVVVNVKIVTEIHGTSQGF